MPEQLPASQFAVGGQPTVAAHIVVSAAYGFEEDSEVKQTSGGQFKCDITYSRRATLDLTLELSNTADPTDYVKGIALDASFVPTTAALGVWEVRNVTRTNTRGPVQLSLQLVNLTDLIDAP
jgi:hypothetical protein